MRSVLRLALVLALLTAGCGSSFYDHTVSMVFVDPPPACPQPVRVYAFPPSDGFTGNAEWASARLGVSRMDRPYTTTIRAEEVHWFWDPLPARKVTLGFFLPCLREDGWWLLDVVPSARVAVPAVAHFCQWGQFEPVESAPALDASVIATLTSQNDWQLQVRISLTSRRRGLEH